ncbi:MAG: hypothetical protein ACOZAN_00335 [Patescibacteria group bacterium]
MSKKRLRSQKISAAEKRKQVTQDPVESYQPSEVIRSDKKKPSEQKKHPDRGQQSKSFSWEKNFGYSQKLIFADLGKTLITSLIILAVLFMILLYTK